MESPGLRLTEQLRHTADFFKKPPLCRRIENRKENKKCEKIPEDRY